MTRPALQTFLRALQGDREQIPWTWDDLRAWLLDDQEKAGATTEDRLRHLRFMENYAPQPVMLHGTRYQFVVSGRLYYKVRKESGAGPGALLKDLKCLKTMGKFLGISTQVWPVQPPQPHRARGFVPTPDEVHRLLHTHYAPNHKRNPLDAWIRHVLAFHFGFDLRSPKEVWFLRVTDYEPDRGMLRVTEPKKLHRERDLYVEPTFLASSRRHLSLDGWLQWREKLDARGDAMFPNPLTGRNFSTPEALKQFLDRRVKPFFPWFHGYGARHWCVYARIIDAGFTDTSYHQVAEWFGHDSADMTRSVYGPSARVYSKSPVYGKQWLVRAFQRMPATHKRETPDPREAAGVPAQ